MVRKRKSDQLFYEYFEEWIVLYKVGAGIIVNGKFLSFKSMRFKISSANLFLARASN